MATDFFQRQSDARRSTVWLIAMFVISVIAIVASVTIIAAIVVQSQLREPGLSIASHPEQIVVPAIAGGITLLIIVGGSLFKVFELQRGGGAYVAESLGGKRIPTNTRDSVQRRVLNVVEEMAIASGTPVPPVYLLDESGINAFAAGYSPSDAVLGITRGCAEQLTRDELQGVVAHEFSHVLNGDMRMSIRLIGILHGILLIGLTGQLIFRMFLYSGSGRHRRSNSNNKDGGQIIILIIAIGVTLLVLGFIGTFFGNLIKAAVSRQREYLADASAVQFTRNPSGIANALKRIGGYAKGSRLKTPAAAEASHMYFSQGVWEGLSGLWATHPPLEKRIRAIEPNWDGKLITSRQTPRRDAASPVAAGFSEGYASSPAIPGGSNRPAHVPPPLEVPVTVVDHAVDYVGRPNTEHQDYATKLLESIPEFLLDTVHEPYGARAVLYALLLDHDPRIRTIQRAVLQKHATADVVRLVGKLQADVDQLDVRARLPLVDMSLPALRSMSPSQYNDFRLCFVGLAKADQQIDLFEWMLSQVLMRHLTPQFETVRRPGVQYYGLQQLAPQCSVLLSIVASAGNSDEVAAASFRRGAEHLPELSLHLLPKSSQSLDALREVLAQLTLVVAKQRGRLVDACADAICADQHVTWQEAELLRGISDLLDCPMPPLIVGTPR
ncbi:MAG: M48 family metallopeptidase [Planctomycetales bacterium]|nr:M48 family metallopeptidase [Planctomycetales bacterium]